MATKAISSSASKGDWILSFGFGDDADSDSDSDKDVPPPDPVSSIVSSTHGTSHSSPHTSEEARLSYELDISKREDSAVFQQNPWSIAKLNAASRLKQPPRNAVVSAQRNTSNATPIEKKTTSTSFRNTASFAPKAPDAQSKQPLRHSKNAFGGSRTSDETRTIRTNAPGITKKLEVRDDVLNLPKTSYAIGQASSNPRRFIKHQTSPPLVQKSAPISHPTHSPPTEQEKPTPDTKAISSLSQLSSRKQLFEYTHYNSSSPYSSPLKKRRLDDHVIGTIRFADRPENPSPRIMKNHNAAAVYSESTYGMNDDKDWTTFQNKKSTSNKRTDKTTGAFPVPRGLLKAVQPLQTTPVKPTVKRTLLTVYQLPPAHSYKQSKEKEDSYEDD